MKVTPTHLQVIRASAYSMHIFSVFSYAMARPSLSTISEVRLMFFSLAATFLCSSFCPFSCMLRVVASFQY